jgi:uncharacterized protein YhfF
MDQPAPNPSAEAYYQRFLASLPPDSRYHDYRWIAEAWGDNPALADELGALIACGKKTASCTTWWEFAAGDCAVPALDLLTVVLDGAGRPLCVVETWQIESKPFHQVDAAFAAAEGEDDGSYRSWREGHWRYFTRSLAALGREPREDMLVVCERYRVIYREDTPA